MTNPKMMAVEALNTFGSIKWKGQAYELTAEGNIERLLEPEVSQIVHARYC